MNKKGFTLVETLIVVVAIGLISGISVFSYQKGVFWSKERVSELDLKTLNATVRLYQNDFADFPEGNNDLKHHQAIIQKFLDKGFFLKKNKKIAVESLESNGAGEQFLFTAYKGVEAKGSQQIKIASPWKNGTPLPSTRSLIPEETLVSSNQSFNEDIDEQIIEKLEERLEERKRQNNDPIKRTLVFDQPGIHEWTVPEGIKILKISLIAAGGSGGESVIQEGWSEIPQTFHSVLTEQKRTYDNCTERIVRKEKIYLSGQRLKILRCPIYVRHNDRTSMYQSNGELDGGFLSYHMHFSIEALTWEEKWVPGKPGESGKKLERTVSVHGGEKIILKVGKSQSNQNGESTWLSIGQSKFEAQGGRMGEGRMIPGYKVPGAGGPGSQIQDLPGLPGESGAVIIQYKS